MSVSLDNSHNISQNLTVDRQTLLASIPDEWQKKFEQELSQSPILRLIAIQVFRQIIETYRHTLEQSLQSNEIEPRKLQKLNGIDIRRDKHNHFTVTISLPPEYYQKPPAPTEESIDQILKPLNFWETSASYMWFDLTKMAFTQMEKDIGRERLASMSQDKQLQCLYRYLFDEVSDTLKSNFLTVLQIYINQAAQLILNKYDLPNKSVTELEWLSGLNKRLPNAPATHPDLFANGTTSNFATCKLLWESVNILTQKADLLWQPDEDGKLTYTSTFRDGRGRFIFWVTDNPEEQYPEALAGEAALAVIEAFDIRAACMHLIYAAHVTTLDKPWEQEFIIDDAQISSYLGLDKRKDLTKEKRLKLIERIAEQPAQILTFLHWPQQGSVESFYVEKSRLWEVAIGYHGQRDLFGDIKCMGLTIRCRAGMWAKYFLNKRGSQEGNAFYQYGVLSKTLLQTITRVWQHSEGAARMLAWLSFRTRVGPNQVMLTSTLMEVAYGVEKVAQAQRDRDIRSVLANRWDNDLRILHEAGMTIEFDAATYPLEIRPDWYEDGRGANKRPKGFWDQLRNSRLYIHPPKELTEGIAKLQRHKQTTKKALTTIDITSDIASNITNYASQPEPRALSASQPSTTDRLTGEQIKIAREAKGWTQEELGNQVGKTKMWISLIERDKRNLRPYDAQQLWTALMQ